MEIIKTKEDSVLKVALKGRLDTLTSPELEASLREDLAGVSRVEIDFAELEYISSAGLRILLSIQKKVGGKDNIIIAHANAVVSEVFHVTGFDKALTLI